MKTNQKKEAYWRRHVEAVKASGLTQKAYCEKHQLKLSASERELQPIQISSGVSRG